jgi:hypothetical protein
MATVADRWILVSSASPDGEPVVGASDSRGPVASWNGGGVGLEALGAGGGGFLDGGCRGHAGRGRRHERGLTTLGMGPPRGREAQGLVGATRGRLVTGTTARWVGQHGRRHWEQSDSVKRETKLKLR